MTVHSAFYERTRLIGQFQFFRQNPLRWFFAFLRLCFSAALWREMNGCPLRFLGKNAAYRAVLIFQAKPASAGFCFSAALLFCGAVARDEWLSTPLSMKERGLSGSFNFSGKTRFGGFLLFCGFVARDEWLSTPLSVKERGLSGSFNFSGNKPIRWFFAFLRLCFSAALWREMNGCPLRFL